MVILLQMEARRTELGHVWGGRRVQAPTLAAAWRRCCAPAYRLTLPQLLLRAVEVEVDVQALHKLRDGVLVCVRLLTRE